MGKIVNFIFCRHVYRDGMLDDEYRKIKYGAVQFKLPGCPFETDMSKDDATIGKVFTLKLLEGMYSLGYDFVTSSDLTRSEDQVFLANTGTFLKKCETSLVIISEHAILQESCAGETTV